MGNRMLRKPVDRRTVLKAATGAAAGFYAWGFPASRTRALAQDSVIQQIWRFPDQVPNRSKNICSESAN